VKREFGQYVVLALILVAAAPFRFYGLDWDRGYLFHPDERKILLVASAIRLPSSVAQFFSPDSPLNPKFFAYGSFPIYLLKALSGIAPAVSYPVPWSDSGLVGLALLGRALSGAFDLGALVLIFLLARRLYGAPVGLLAAACGAVTVEQIQLSHFYAVDTLLTFFIVATVFFAARYVDSAARVDAALMAIAFGLAMATKISAAPLIVPMTVAVVRATCEDTKTQRKQFNRPRVFVSLWFSRVRSVRKPLAKIFGVAFAVFIVTQPYALLDPVQYLGQVGTESLVARGWLDYPYTRQFANTLPYLYQIWQSSLWGMSLPLGIFAWGGSALFMWQWWRAREWRDGFILSWALVYFVIIGGQYAKYPRYLLPLIPFLFLMAAAAISRVARPVLRITFYVLLAIALVAASVYSLAFISIYSRGHPWLQISNWIYQNVPAGSAVAIEQWDDALPVPVRAASGDHNPTAYRVQALPMYDADNATKLQTLVDALAASDYIILASPRLYATIARLPQRYPISSRYYRLLFSGRLGFELVAFARDDPTLASITIVDDALTPAGLPLPMPLAQAWRGAGVWDWGRADESFTVYDHPMPLVFKKTRALSRGELSALFSSP
jgi:hypothetical protein